MLVSSAPLLVGLMAFGAIDAIIAVQLTPYGNSVQLDTTGSINHQFFSSGTNYMKWAQARRAQLIANADKASGRLKKRRLDDRAKAPDNTPVTNTIASYVVSMSLGANTGNLVIDTGSSDTWIGAATHKYVTSSTTVPQNKSCGVGYGSGQFIGNAYTDTVTIRPGLAVSKQLVCGATNAVGFNGGIDGILGLGPAVLDSGTINGLGSFPTVMDSMRSQGIIKAEVVSAYFKPYSGTSSTTNGRLTFGNVDPSAYRGNIVYTPLTTKYPSNYYWGINLQAITYGGTALVSASSTKSITGIVDTGTTLIPVPTDVFNAYIAATPNASIDSASGLIIVPVNQMSNIKPLTFMVNGQALTLSPAQQVFPLTQNAIFGLSNKYYYSYIVNSGATSGSGLDFILGQKFLEM